MFVVIFLARSLTLAQSSSRNASILKDVEWGRFDSTDSSSNRMSRLQLLSSSLSWITTVK